MKKLLLPILILLLFVNSVTAHKKEEIIITGKIIGDISKKVEYTTPINGTWFYGSKQSVKPDYLGNFQITMNIDSPSFITLYIPKKANGTLLVEPGKTYNINFTSKDKKFIVSGKNSKGQNIYNSFPNPEFRVSDLKDFLKDSIPSVISSKIKTKKEKEVSLFKVLFDEGEISEGFFKLVKLDRECYYGAIQGNVASYKFRESYQKNNGELKARSLDLWNDMFKTVLISNPMLSSSPWFYALVENYINYKEYTNPSFNLNELTKIYKLGQIHSHMINESKKYLAKNKLEYFNASYLYYHCWQTKDNSKELITLCYNFEKNYSNSKYSKYLTSIIEPILEYHRQVKEISINTEIKFIDDFENIDSFDELTKRLRGKKTYIDIWGTWCGPCKKEFQYKNELNNLLNSKDMNMLYICEGRNSKEKVWREMIKGYNLLGYHTMTNKELLADIIKIFGQNGSFYYPRYILIDENGNIINKYAAKPSELEVLKKQLRKTAQN